MKTRRHHDEPIVYQETTGFQQDCKILYREGYEAHNQGRSLFSCPHNGEWGRAWKMGWRLASRGLPLRVPGRFRRSIPL